MPQVSESPEDTWSTRAPLAEGLPAKRSQAWGLTAEMPRGQATGCRPTPVVLRPLRVSDRGPMRDRGWINITESRKEEHGLSFLWKHQPLAQNPKLYLRKNRTWGIGCYPVCKFHP